jgi:hypothetical protein
MKEAMVQIEKKMNDIVIYKKAIKELEMEIQQLINQYCDVDSNYSLKTHVPQPTKSIIVRVKFNNNGKTYDYRLIGEDIHVAIGDTVYISTPWHDIKEVEIVDYRETTEAIDLSVASYSEETLIEYINTFADN